MIPFRERILLCMLVLCNCKRMEPVRTTGFILGPTNDIVPYEDQNSKSNDVSEVAAAAVLLATSLESKTVKFCSGSLLENEDDRETLSVLTNFHCFAKASKDGKIENKFLDEACVTTKVYIGFKAGKTNSADIYPCMEGSLRGDYEGDLAVFSIKREGKGKDLKALKVWKDGDVPKDRRAFIIHHPDVKERYENTEAQSRLPTASITTRDCQTEGTFAYREWLLDQALPYSLKHTCDLINGSSGSALIDSETHSILGVNWGGIEIKYRGEGKRYNAATRADYIRAFLAGDVKSIQQEIMSKSKLGEGSDQVLESEVSSGEGNIKSGSCGVVGVIPIKSRLRN